MLEERPDPGGDRHPGRREEGVPPRLAPRPPGQELGR